MSRMWRGRGTWGICMVRTLTCMVRTLTILLVWTWRTVRMLKGFGEKTSIFLIFTLVLDWIANTPAAGSVGLHTASNHGTYAHIRFASLPVCKEQGCGFPSSAPLSLALDEKILGETCWAQTRAVDENGETWVQWADMICSSVDGGEHLLERPCEVSARLCFGSKFLEAF